MSEMKKIKLIVSDEKPHIDGAEEVTISMVDHSLAPAQAIAARLCAGNGTCVAIIETE
jgi:hypothetical protein